MTNTMILTIAVAKGYLFSASIKRLGQAGIYFNEGEFESRKLYFYDKKKQVKILQIRPWDVPIYVEHGAADLGFVGKDVLLERHEDVAELLDLKFGGCKLVIAGKHAVDPENYEYNLEVATKYPYSTEKYFREKGIKINLIKLYGAVELSPLTGVSDIISDLTVTGKTLKENHLQIIDTIFESTCRLVANRVSLKYKYKQIKSLMEILSRHVTP